jgi:signal transduction histidine kinase/HAMP domain-containing protein
MTFGRDARRGKPDRIGASDLGADDLRSDDPGATRRDDLAASHSDDPTADQPARTRRLDPGLSFRARLTLAILGAAILPLIGLGLIVVATGVVGADQTVGRILLFALAVTIVLAVLLAYLLVAELLAPLRRIATSVERVSAGDLDASIEVPGDDELARLADSHNALAADLARRNRELGRILEATTSMAPGDGMRKLVERAGREAERAFDLLDATVVLGDPATVPEEEAVPGEARQLRAELRVGDEPLGLLVGRLSATRRWEPADQDLLELYASEVAVAIRNAELFARVELQNQRLVALDGAKDDFLRGVSHNLQTPLARIRAYAAQLDEETPDRRLAIVVEQADRLSRMVRQLLTVTRLESGALRPRTEVLALAPRVRRTWEALSASGTELRLDDAAEGWLAVADADQLDQVFWALLDNATKYGGGASIEVRIAIRDRTEGLLAVTVEDHGPGIDEADRERLFGRFERGSPGSESGSGLGLYVSRELCRAMGGDLLLEPAGPGHGAAFTVLLPGEVGEES